MTNLEDFVIDTPYIKTEDDEGLIREASPQVNHSEDWEKSCLSDFKARVRDYYRKKQNRRCAYCRTIVKTSQASAEIEHIIPKSERPEWMYEPLNYCMSCKMCNTKKSTNGVLKDGVYKSFPNDSTDYLIVHPHLDKYSQHINIIDGILYEGLTDKGKETIRICKLDRYELAVERAEDIMIREKKSLDEKVLLLLVKHDGNPLVNLVEKFEERIHEIYEEYKQQKNDN